MDTDLGLQTLGLQFLPNLPKISQFDLSGQKSKMICSTIRSVYQFEIAWLSHSRYVAEVTVNNSTVGLLYESENSIKNELNVISITHSSLLIDHMTLNIACWVNRMLNDLIHVAIIPSSY